VEQRQSDLGLSHQHVRAVATLPDVFHELSDVVWSSCARRRTSAGRKAQL
jgi:hypothetical protein